MSDRVKRQSGNADAKMAEEKAESAKEGGECVKSDTNVDSAQPSETSKEKKVTPIQRAEIARRYLNEHVTMVQLAVEYGVHHSWIGRIIKPFKEEHDKAILERIQRNAQSTADTLLKDIQPDYVKAREAYAGSLERIAEDIAQLMELPVDTLKEKEARNKLLKSLEDQRNNILWRMDGQKAITAKTLAPLGVSTGGGGASGDIGPQATIYNLYIKNVNVATPDALTQHERDKKAIEADFEVEE